MEIEGSDHRPERMFKPPGVLSGEPWYGDLLPAEPVAVLDIGSDRGQAAAWLAGLGHAVVAVDSPARTRSRFVGMARTGGSGSLRWCRSQLPELRSVYEQGLSFDLILLASPWHDVDVGQQSRAFRKIAGLLKPGGQVLVTLPLESATIGRLSGQDPSVSLGTLARQLGAIVVFEEILHGNQVSRGTVDSPPSLRMALRLPDDGTGALPQLRHIILNDRKSATYKLGLLRAIARAADGSQGLGRYIDDDFVSVPLGLVALNWMRLYKPLVEAGLPQTPTNRGVSGLGFAGKGWNGIAALSPLDLRLGAEFRGANADSVDRALLESARHIEKMPARYITHPGSSEPVFRIRRQNSKSRRFRGDRLHIDETYLRRFGGMLVPIHLWRALGRFDVWVEPALTSEWKALMGDWAKRQGRELEREPGLVDQALQWSDPKRDVEFARREAERLLGRRALYCVWTGRRLTGSSLDIDHCLPWSAWPCDDLWNLMPSDRRTNQREKRQKLPSAVRLDNARERILDWWDAAYVSRDEAACRRFMAEARGSLPLGSGLATGLEDIFEGVHIRRTALRVDQRVEEWNGE